MKSRFALLTAVALVTATAQAHPHEGHRGPDIDRMAVLLELDDTQKSEVERILNEQREKMRAAREQAKASGTRPTREEMKQMRQTHQQELNAQLQTVLNDEQMKRFDALREWRRDGKRKARPQAGE